MVRILDNLRISYTLSAQREALLTTLALGQVRLPEVLGNQNG